MKNLLIILFVAGFAPCTTNAMNLDAPDYAFPIINEPTVHVESKDLMNHAQKMPDELFHKLAQFTREHELLITQLLGTDYLPLHQLFEERSRNRQIIEKAKQTGLIETIFPGTSNYVMTLRDIPGYVLKFVTPNIKVANVAKKANKEEELNTSKCVADYLTLCKDLDDLNGEKPELALLETYQAASNILAAQRITQAQSTYGLDSIVAVPTYPCLLDEQETPHDRNCFTVQQFVPGSDFNRATLTGCLTNVDRKEQIIKSLKQFYVLALAAKLWKAKDVRITPEGFFAPVAFEKRDRYVQPYITAGESVHLAHCLFEEVGQIFDIENYSELKELHEPWENMLMKNQEAQDLLKTRKRIVMYYPRVQELLAQQTEQQ